jgi:UDP-glucose 6-dehydrogenase
MMFFLKSLEHSLAPTGGWGMGNSIDHLVMFLTDSTTQRVRVLYRWNGADFSFSIYGPDVVCKARDRNLFFSANVQKGIEEADLIFVNVNMPMKKSGVGAGFAADLKYVVLFGD